MRIPRAACWAVVSLLAWAPLARSQDSHYWTNHYGTRATLLGGAVIGSVLDLSGTYYNPGGLSLLEKPATLMAAQVFQYPRLTLAGNDHKAVPQNSTNLGPAPSLLAGTIRVRGLDKHWFGYSFLLRQSVKLGVSVSSAGIRDVLPERPGAEDYVTQFKLDEKIAESWFGLTWSYKIGRNTGVGLTQYVAARSHRASVQELVEALDGSGRAALALGSRQYRYSHIRVLWKFGLACDYDDITVGLTLTTPSVALTGTGSSGANSTIAGLDMDGDGAPDDYLAADYQDHRRTTYRTPVSLAAGLTVKIDKVRVYGSAEWFARVPAYAVVDTMPFAAQSTGEILSTDVTQELSPVFNAGLGLEWFYSSRFKGYASYTTDFSARGPETATNISLTDWDIHHVVTGAEFFIKRTALTFGLGLSLGRREIGNRPDVLERGGLSEVWDPFDHLKFRFTNYKLIFGIAI
ncbi:MAG: hypothetical protein KA243_04375 [Candidatus Aminicenantes bacterium]|nr:hypothetical protein [Candidatus Aminicenantes bacterium]NLH75971.1 hypothetical protein [Acidobacteriota bacterium]